MPLPLSLRIVTLGLLCGVLFFMSACQTTGKTEEPGTIRAGAPIPFYPVSPESSLQWSEGRYPDLYHNESRAFLDTSSLILPEPAPADSGGAGAVPAGPPPGTVQIQCKLVSKFADMSIAYDVVGLRGVQTYLLTPSGSRVQPLQTTVGTDLIESNEGALKRFTRVNILVFPAAALIAQVPQPGQAGPPMRLVLEGHGSVFHFDWAPRQPMAMEVTSDQSSGDRFREKSRRATSKLKKWSHTFD